MEQYRLKRNERIRLDREVADKIVSCAEGVLWLTQTGIPGDHLIRAGETFRIAASGRIVVSALADSAFTLAEGRATSRLFAGMLQQAVRQTARRVEVTCRRLWA